MDLNSTKRSYTCNDWSKIFWSYKISFHVAFWHAGHLVFSFWHPDSSSRKCFFTLFLTPVLLLHGTMYLLSGQCLTYVGFLRSKMKMVSLVIAINLLCIRDRFSATQVVNLIEPFVEDCVSCRLMLIREWGM